MTKTASPLASLFVALTLIGGCAGDETGDIGDDAGVGETDGKGDDPEDYPEVATALLEVYTLDAWAQFLPAAEVSVTRQGRPEAIPTTGYPVVRLAVDEAASYELELSALDHHPATITVDFDGSDAVDGASLGAVVTNGGGLTISHEMRTIRPDEPAVPVHTIYVGLRHKWFAAAGAPARRNNRIDFLMDGEEAWAAVYNDLTQATESVALATWWWESVFELVRDEDDHIYQSESERRANTILSILDRSPATKRVIVSQLWGQDGILDWMTADSDIRDRGAAGGDDFEFMGQANETEGEFLFKADGFSFGERVRAGHDVTGRDFEVDAQVPSSIPSHQVDLGHWPVGIDIQHASYHQKFMVVDNDVAFIGGMNLRRVDWDTNEHLVFDPRRMLFDATQAEREAVADHDEFPDTGPRKDYMVRIEGPAAQDAADIFKKRWDLLRYEGVEYSNNSSAFEVVRDITAVAGGSQVQVTATLPDPLWQHSIAESWLNAVANAEDYILIEDQYFRAPLLNDAIVARMNQDADLRLIVITKPVDEWVDPGCAWTHTAHARFESLFPNRYQMLQLRAFASAVTWGFDETEGYFHDMDVHSKLIIIDDTFLSVGSANKNNRGMIYEGELNVAVVDRDWVRAVRRRLLANILPSSVVVSDDVTEWSAELDYAAEWNDYVWDNWDDEGFDISLDGAALPMDYTPRGFVYSLDFRTVADCLIEDIGPDMV